ncbi:MULTISPECIES: phosphoribosylformylglycinamidine synthase [Dehalobacter]|uniref:Phosphoribosylformylglycinamidine synthase n=1 Tax=Dehalobacter restrictus (strain DSM 9455 / PER-K23) TaxID=871738 RepID=A0ABM5P8J3_DEHRP|nr:MULTISPECIES: phosphoribosylformylglycinamidine synthase [Dehalobacter]AHF11020.1 phosphoribosylformylglycinamidine synthase [Dehalobacter restrictus DSM 9455]MDJ0307034.1 phosphoribosylformylglycinamidine synthase [Dehalobacter sp.]OCZ49575.1 phosphoribosylformylglycinamidine synthase [Dehalobacter sp. TeCB1]
MLLQAVKRLYVEKKQGFNIEAQGLFADLRDNLSIAGLQGVRTINRYDISGITDEEYEKSRTIIFAEPPLDILYEETLDISSGDRVFAMEYLPGQYDQRADSAAQCIQMLTQKERPLIASAKVIILEGKLSDQDFARIKQYCINPVESREASLAKPQSLEFEAAEPADVETMEGFITKTPEEITAMQQHMNLAMSVEDLLFCQSYFRDTEKRNPTMTEIKTIDTYWSDHCRHTTFQTEIEEVDIKDGIFSGPIKTAFDCYKASRAKVYQDKLPTKDICLMDIATIGMKELKMAGLLDDLDESDEINACSIVVTAEVNGREEEWLVMFKNETHNHPTEIEPFGGAATCLGGAIRDPLSGRTYVYQAMRVTGSGDPRAKVEDTLSGKLPQRKITTVAAAGYSSYGNQIGLATGQVAEVYDEGFIAKRMEIGAVIGAAPRKNVIRKPPEEGDVIVLVGGRTGRDGCGGATGSSKEHTLESLTSCGAEVQKGNPPNERKIQRLFRNPEVSTLIKKCNDFGAGGVSVAVGELTDGLDICLDAVPKKYESLDGTELAISESQERMAVVLAAEDWDKFKCLATEENLEATIIARVTGDHRLKMSWRSKTILDLSRDFLNTNGVKQKTKVEVAAPLETQNYFNAIPSPVTRELPDLRKAWNANLGDLNVCSKKGLIERFDSTIGAASVLMPLGGKYQLTPAEGMVAKLPVLEGDTTTATIMTYGYNPQLAKWSPFHGALYAVLDAVAKAVAIGGDYRKIRLTLQEYFGKLNDAGKWGQPFSALLGAYYAQKQLGIPAIGGKDSMSGSFMELNVPPTLVAFAVCTADARKVVSQEFKQAGSNVVLLKLTRDEQEIPDFTMAAKNFVKVLDLIQLGWVRSSRSIRMGGIAGAVSEMAFGNMIGFHFSRQIESSDLFQTDYGSILLELDEKADLPALFGDVEYELLGCTQEKPAIAVNGVELLLTDMLSQWEMPLEKIFPSKVENAENTEKPRAVSFDKRSTFRPAIKAAKPRVFIPVFPGTNCEYDSAKAFTKAGGLVETMVIRNLSAADIEGSIKEMVKIINNSQIIMLPGGFSAGDEPDGSGKFIATLFNNPRIKDAVMNLLKQRDGLMLGICNGFQALIKLGLVPYGEIKEINAEDPTLTYNKIGRHVSCMARTKVVSTLSPWFSGIELGETHTIPVSHGEGRFVASPEVISKLIQNGQIATQYVDLNGTPSNDSKDNSNGSFDAIEGITSPDGRVLGKMAHSERTGTGVAVNVPGNKYQPIFEGGIHYFK